MTANRDLSSAPGVRSYLLRGLVRCRSILADGTVCGRAYAGSPGSQRQVDGTQRLYYHCSGGRGHAQMPSRPRCVSRSIPMAVLEDRVWADVAAFVRNPGPRLKAARLALLEARPSPPDRIASELDDAPCWWADDDAECERPAVTTRYSIVDRRWVPVCDDHRR